MSLSIRIKGFKVTVSHQSSATQAKPVLASLTLTMWITLLVLASGGARADSIGKSFFDDLSTFDLDRWYVSDGWSNGNHQNCLWSESAVVHKGDQLGLLFFQQDSPTHAYRCGEIQTRQRFTHGTYEARIKTNEGSGLNAAFFTYIGPTHGERHDEIDIEILTANPQDVTVNTYVDGVPMHGAVVPLPQAAHEAFHIYAFTWEPGRLRWYINGQLIHDVSGPHLPERPQKIYLSLWGSDTLTDWMGPFVKPDRPKRMDIDWIAFTALGEDCQFPDSILCATSGDVK